MSVKRASRPRRPPKGPRIVPSASERKRIRALVESLSKTQTGARLLASDCAKRWREESAFWLAGTDAAEREAGE